MSDRQYPESPSNLFNTSDKKYITDSPSPTQYSSIERKINQEDFCDYDRKYTDSPYSTASTRQAYSTPKSPAHQHYNEYVSYNKCPQPYGEDKSYTSVHEVKSHSHTCPHAEEKPYSPALDDESFAKLYDKQYATIHDNKSYTTIHDNKSFASSNDRFSMPSPMSTFKSQRPSDFQTFTSGIPQNQTYRQAESKPIPGGKVETITTQMYTSTPGKSTGSNFETSQETREFSSSNNDVIPVDNNGYEGDSHQRTVTKTQKVTEKKTVTMTMSSRQEKNTKTIKYEDQ